MVNIGVVVGSTRPGRKAEAVAVRGLLPYELVGGTTSQPPIIPSPDQPIDPTELTCSPADGLMEVP